MSLTRAAERGGAGAFVLSAALLGLGVPLVFAAEALAAPLRVPPALLLVPAFLAYNVLLARRLGLARELAPYWRFNGRALAWGAALGLALALLPPAIARASGRAVPVAQALPLELYSALATFLVVLWEELWFRGIALNYLADERSTLAAAAFTSALFAAVHALNPALELGAVAPNLFLASLAMAAGYFRFRSIHFSIALHFVWNLLHEPAGPLFLGVSAPAGRVWGENGMIVTLGLLAIAAALLLRPASPWRNPGNTL